MNWSAVTVEIMASTPALVPCVYCRAGIEAASFEYWSSTKSLLSAACPTCERRVTIPALTWQRWTGGPVEVSR